MELIELANRLWLPRLVTLVEAEVIKQASLEISYHSQSPPKTGSDAIGHGSDVGVDLTEEALSILQPCQVSTQQQNTLYRKGSSFSL